MDDMGNVGSNKQQLEVWNFVVVVLVFSFPTSTPIVWVHESCIERYLKLCKPKLFFGFVPHNLYLQSFSGVKVTD